MSFVDALVDAQAKEAGWTKPEREFRFHATRRWRFDYAWPTGERIALEIDGGLFLAGGGRHNRGASMLKDMEKHNAAAVEGWRVLRLTPQQVKAGKLTELLRSVLG